MATINPYLAFNGWLALTKSKNRVEQNLFEGII